MSNLSATASVIRGASANLVIKEPALVVEAAVEPIMYVVAVDAAITNDEVNIFSPDFNGIVRRKILERVAS